MSKALIKAKASKRKAGSKNQLGTTQIQMDSVIEEGDNEEESQQAGGTYNWTSKLKQKQDEPAGGPGANKGCCEN